MNSAFLQTYEKLSYGNCLIVFIAKRHQTHFFELTGFITDIVYPAEHCLTLLYHSLYLHDRVNQNQETSQCHSRAFQWLFEHSKLQSQ